MGLLGVLPKSKRYILYLPFIHLKIEILNINSNAIIKTKTAFPHKSENSEAVSVSSEESKTQGP